jgi:hypothetical protein
MSLDGLGIGFESICDAWEPTCDPTSVRSRAVLEVDVGLFFFDCMQAAMIIIAIPPNTDTQCFTGYSGLHSHVQMCSKDSDILRVETTLIGKGWGMLLMRSGHLRLIWVFLA